MTTAALRPRRTNDPYNRRNDLTQVIALRLADKRPRQEAIRALVTELTTKDVGGHREVTTISARDAIAWVLDQVAAGYRQIGHAMVVDRFGTSLDTADRMFTQLRTAGLLWRVHRGRKGQSVSIWSLAPRAVAALSAKLAQLRKVAEHRRSQYRKKREGVSHLPSSGETLGATAGGGTGHPPRPRPVALVLAEMRQERPASDEVRREALAALRAVTPAGRRATRRRRR